MFKSILSKVGFGELPSSFGFSVGDKVDLPFSWHWDLHKGQKKSDGSTVSVFVCGKKDLDSQQTAAAKNAVQMAKSLRHTRIVRALDSIEVDSGFYLVTEQVAPMLADLSGDAEERDPAVWGLYEALDGLGFLHQSGFTHGLFGPGAILVTPRGDYRLGVFDLCRKDADAGSLLAQRRRCGLGLIGWPDPPAHLQDGGAPTCGIDLWGAALLMAYVFGSVRGSGKRGADFRVDMSRAAQDLPPELRKSFAELVKPGPLRGRSPIGELIQLPFFQQHASVRVMSFLGNLHIQSQEEKDRFFENLPKLLESTPETLQTKQVLPELLEAQKFPGQEAAQVLPAILKIGIRLKDDEFKASVAPLVAQLFASPDRSIRFRLLSSLGEMIDLLDDGMINDKIFPECVNGFTDSSGPIREATVKSLIHFVPRLKAKTVEGRVVKLLVKVMADPEASIRTNAVICSGRISTILPAAVANQTLSSMLAAGFKDNFAPCRNAALQTLLATCSVFSVDELAQKMMPFVCLRLVDPDPGVSASAFQVLSSLHEHMKEQVEQRRARSDVADAGGAAGAAASGGIAKTGSGNEAQAAGTWGSWAFSTVGSVVGNKIMGSMGERAASASPMSSAPTGAGASAPPPPPPVLPPASLVEGGAQASSSTGGRPAAARSGSGGGRGGGMKLGGAAGQNTGPVAASWGGDFDFDDDSPAGGGAAAPGDAWGGDDDFFGEDISSPTPAPAPAPVARAASKATAAAVAAQVAKAKPVAAKAKAAPVAKILDDADTDDFWKQFDM